MTTVPLTFTVTMGVSRPTRGAVPPRVAATFAAIRLRGCLGLGVERTL